MMNLFLFLGIVFLLTFVIGRFLEKIRIPWIFSALLLGVLLAIKNPFSSITSMPEFKFLANLGMYFLLFIIGFELDIAKLRKQEGFIFRATFFIVLLEALFGTFLITMLFGYDLFISFIVALSFATVGEAVLVPILDEFKIVNSKLGQSILGIGTLDDLLEVIVLIIVILTIGTSSSVHHTSIALVLTSLIVLFGLAFGLMKFKKEGKKFRILDIESVFIFTLFILFLFLGVGEYAHAAPLAALFSGVALKTFLPEKRLKTVESELKTMCYGFFAPLFFLWVGSTMDVNYIVSVPLFVLLVVLLSAGAKVLGSWIVGKKYLGGKRVLLLGTALSTRFSTSIIIIKILFEKGLIESGLYSVIVASSIVFTCVIPFIFSRLLLRWNLVRG